MVAQFDELREAPRLLFENEGRHAATVRGVLKPLSIQPVISAHHEDFQRCDENRIEWARVR